MKILIDRKYKKTDYTISNLYIDSKYFCNVLEDTDRGLTQNSPLSEIKATKVYGKTAIPTGTYKVTLDVVSNRFKSSSFFQEVCGAKLPRLLNVPGFDGILIHTGNTAEDTDGCLIVGENKIKGKVVNSRETFKKLYSELLKDKGNITIEIK